MPASRNSGARKVEEESDSDFENRYETQQQALDNEARIRMQRRLQEMDLGTVHKDRLTASDKPQRPEDRANVGALLRDRDVNKPGTEAHALYSQNKAATNAWNNPANIGDNHEENLDPLDHGNSHRQRMRNQYGGRIEDPNDIEAGYNTGSQGGFIVRGEIASRGGRGAGLAPTNRGAGRSASSNYTPTYCPLDPAVDPTEPRSKYRGAAPRGGAPAGRGGAGGNVDLKTGRARFGQRAASVGATAPSRPPRRVKNKNVDMLADPASFMQAVEMMKSRRPDKTATTTTPASIETMLSKASGEGIDSNWGDSSTIRQVPTDDLALPRPHCGDTESRTDGVQSAHLSSLHSTPIESEPHSHGTRPPSPAVSNTAGVGVGLGIQGLATSMSESTAPYSSNTAGGVDLIDLADDLSALNEAPAPRALLAQRIFVNGAWYILDRSAIANAVPEPSDPAPTPVARSPNHPTPMLQPGDWATPAQTTGSTAEHKKPSAFAKATSTLVDQSTIIDTQNTSFPIDSRWASTHATNRRDSLKSSFTGNTARSRILDTQVPCRSHGDFNSFVGHRPEGTVSTFFTSQLGFRDDSTSIGLTSSARIGSITSSPSEAGILGESIWATTGARVNNKASADGTQISAVPVAVNASAPAVQDAAMKDADLDASQIAVIDAVQLVRLQRVGNASAGMTPFRPGTIAPPAAITAPTRPSHAHQHSSAIGTTGSNVTSSVRGYGLTTSKYANQDISEPTITQAMPVVQSSSPDTDSPRAVGDASPRLNTTGLAFGTGSNVSRFAGQNENYRPAPKLSGSAAKSRPSFGHLIANNTRCPAGPGYAGLLADAKAVPAAATSQPSVRIQTTGLLPSLHSPSNQPSR